MTEHLSEEQLVLHYYGEAVEPQVESHLAACEQCREGFCSLQRLLNVVDSFPVPERSAEYGSAVWQRIAPQVPLRASSRWQWLWTPRQWAASAALAAMLVAAFFAGRWTERRPEPAPLAQSNFDQRVLLTAVGNHLDRSQIVLVDLANEQDNIEPQLDDVRDLLEANRLYRSSATQAGERQLAEVLDELERLLVEVAHLTPKLTPQATEELRSRIMGQGILLKVRITGSEVREREKLEF